MKLKLYNLYKFEYKFKLHNSKNCVYFLYLGPYKEYEWKNSSQGLILFSNMHHKVGTIFHFDNTSTVGKESKEIEIETKKGEIRLFRR